MEKIFLYLDDIRTPENPNNEWIDGIPEWQVVRSYDEFVAHVQKNGLDAYSIISLDHDLGDTVMDEFYNNSVPNYTINYDNIKEKTGYDVAKWLVSESLNTGIPLPRICVHSANPIGAANIMGYINNYLKICRRPQNCIRVQIPIVNK